MLAKKMVAGPIHNRLAVLLVMFLIPSQLPAADEAAEDATEQKIEAAAVDLGRPVDFTKDVLPILSANCIACHNESVTESNLNLENVESILKGGAQGAALVAKKPEESRLFQLASRGDDSAMPPLPNEMEAKALTPKQLGILRQWILEGAAAGSGGTRTPVNWQPVPAGMKSIYSVSLSSWGRWIATGRANRIVIYDAVSGQKNADLTDPALGEIQFDGKPMYEGGAAHRDFVHALAFNPDENLLASAGYRVVKLWQRANNVASQQIGFDVPVTAVTVSPDGNWIAVGLTDGRIHLRNLADDQQQHTLTGHTAAVTGVAFSLPATDADQNPPQLLSSSLDKSIRLWNLSEPQQLGQLDTPAAVNDVAFNHNGSKIISAGADNLIRVWNAADIQVSAAAASEDTPPAESPAVKPVLEIKGHEKPVTSIAVVLPGGEQLLSGSEDGTVRVWELNTGKQLKSLAHGGPVTDVAVRPDGQVVASAGENNVAKLWQLTDGKQIAEMKGDVHAQRRITLHNESKTVAGQKVNYADQRVKAAEKNSKDRDETAKKSKTAKDASEKAITEAMTKDKAELEKLTAAKAELAKKSDDKDLQKKVADAEKVSKAASAALKKAVETQRSATRSQQLSEKAVEAAKKRLEGAQAKKKSAEEHQKKIEAELAELQKAAATLEKPIRSIAFSRDGTMLASTGDDNVVHLWNASNGRALETLVGHSAPVAALAFGAGSTLVSGSADQKTFVWNTQPGWKLVARLGADKDNPLDVTASPFASRVLALDFSIDGNLLATGGGDPSRTGEVMLWDVAKHSLVRNFENAHSDTVLGLDFSRDGKYLLSGSADKFVKMFEVATGNHVRSFEGHTHHVLGVAWKADGNSIVSGGADNAIKIWNTATGEQARTISKHAKQVTSVQFMGVGENIVSSGGDKTVRFHRTTNGQNFRNFGGGTDFMYSAAASRDELLVVAGGEDGVLRIWNGKDGKVIRTHGP